MSKNALRNLFAMISITAVIAYLIKDGTPAGRPGLVEFSSLEPVNGALVILIFLILAAAAFLKKRKSGK